MTFLLLNTKEDLSEPPTHTHARTPTAIKAI